MHMKKTNSKLNLVFILQECFSPPNRFYVME